MERQKNLIYNSDWSMVMVLDACRYDFLENIYSRFLDGDLAKVKSEGSYTKEWFENTFTAPMTDVVYVNSNPLIPYKIPGWENRFHRAVNATEDAWSDEYMTMLPKEVGRIARLTRARHPRKKVIVHFMQPHRPYMALKDTEFDLFGLKRFKERMDGETPGPVDKVRKFIGDLLFKLIGGRRTYLLRKRLGLGGPGYLERIVEEKNRPYLFSAYAENVKEVLGEVRKVVERVPDEDIVVTADHGELLGEDGIYEHPIWSDHPVLREVPWLRVEKNED